MRVWAPDLFLNLVPACQAPQHKLVPYHVHAMLIFRFLHSGGLSSILPQRRWLWTVDTT
ncbi:hypothetical protein BJX64DRAFT_252929 [Aspergillus heterothallicus]